MAEKHKISVITPIYNNSGTLERYLKAVTSSAYEYFEVILIDDCSEDNPQRIIKDYYVIYRRLTERKGSAHARNKGAEIAKGDILLFIDSDITVYRDAIGKTAAIFSKHPEISALIGSYDDSPDSRNFTSQFKFLYHHYIHQREPEYLRTFWTGYGAIKKDVFEKLGRFDLTFFDRPNAINDIELGYRLSKHGLIIYNAKEIQVRHLKRLSFFEWISTDFFDRALPWMKIISEYKEFRAQLNIHFKERLSVGTVGLMCCFFPVSFLNPDFLFLLFLLFVLFICLNFKLLIFFIGKRGPVFSIFAVFYLAIFYFISGAAVIMYFSMGLGKRLILKDTR